MKWKPIKYSPKLTVVNCTMLAAFDEEKCKYCGKYGCTDRGYTITAGESNITVGEAVLGRQMIEKLNGIIENSPLKEHIHVVNYDEPQCFRKLKKNNAEAVLEKIVSCGPDCQRNGNPCPFRNDNFACQRNVELDNSPLICMPKDKTMVDCEFHEKAFDRCRRRDDDGFCTELSEKFAVSGDSDLLVMLSHRFSAAPCLFNVENSCTNKDSLYFEGTCTLQGLMANCEQYKPVDSTQAYTEGVCTYVCSADGKDDRKIFNTSGYVVRLSSEKANTLCLACRISHCIAKATGLKCLGVRRSSKNPFLNETNPFMESAIQINYLYLTHPEDVAKYNPDLMAQAVYDALHKNCKGIGCDEIGFCKFFNL